MHPAVLVVGPRACGKTTTTTGWPATGRIVRLTMYPLVGRECHGDPRSPSLIDRLASDGPDTFDTAPSDWDLHRYLTGSTTYTDAGIAGS